MTGPWWLDRDPEDVPDLDDVTFGRAEAVEPHSPAEVLPGAEPIKDPWAVEGPVEGPVGPDPF